MSRDTAVVHFQACVHSLFGILYPGMEFFKVRFLCSEMTETRVASLSSSLS